MTTPVPVASHAILERPPAPSQRRAVSPALPISERGCTILLATADDRQAALVTSGLADLERAQIRRIDDAHAMATHLVRAEADAVIVVSPRPDPNLIATLRAITAARPLPVVLFVAEADHSEINAAIGAGASALVVDGLHADRIASILQVTLCRFKAEEALRAELAQVKSDLAARKTIERAKGILMERRRLTEADAYAMLRRSAMQGGKTVAEIAEAIIAADRLLTG